MRISLGLVVFILFSLPAFGFADVDFDHSNGYDRMKEYSVKYIDPDADKLVQLLKENYNKLLPSKITSSPNPIIPKVIHQIWLGNASIPQNYKYYLETWKKHHPDWEFKLWTEKEILAENFASMDLYKKARSYAEKADIVRYEILYRYGGLYIDTDIECYTKFDDLHHKYNFYVNMEPPAVNKKRVSILNAMIGSVPKHPIFTAALANIRNNWNSIEENFEKNFSNSRSSFARSSHNLAVLRTMHSFGDAVLDYLSSKDQPIDKNMVLPGGYNIPYYFVNRYPLINSLSLLFRNKSKVTNKIIIQPETMSFHFYDKNNSLLPDMSFARGLYNGSWTRGYTNKLFHLKDKYYLAFEDLFNLNSPIYISYKLKPTIVEVIYVENSGNLSADSLNELKSAWQDLNPDFQIELVNKQPLIKRFYLLKNQGGVYVESSFKPVNLQEFQYKYDFYTLADTAGAWNKLSISTKIIAGRAGHTIFNNLIADYENLTSDLAEENLKQRYLENVYMYYKLDGKSIVLPEIYFNKKRS